jgi:ABC-type microcin C transport system duplicated ATPase subunit YejF
VHISGEAIFKERHLLQMSPHELREIRGREMAMIFQDPLNSLNPVLTVGMQMLEMVQLHQSLSRKEAIGLIEKMITDVGIPDAKTIIKRYPRYGSFKQSRFVNC